MIEIKNLTKAYGKSKALDDVSFTVYGGEILGIAGIAGSGQRELLESIAGLQRLEFGDIFYFDPKTNKKESLRDNMTNMELILNMLAEGTTTEISKTENPEGFDESKIIAQEGGEFAGEYRQKLEKRIGKKL